MQADKNTSIFLKDLAAYQRIKLGDVAHIKTGKRNNQDKNPFGKYPFFVRSSTIEKIDTYSFDGEAILMPGEGNIGDIIHYIDGKFDFHQRVYKISNFIDGIYGKYVFYALQKSFKTWALKNTVKATVDSLRLPTFQGFEFLAPDFQQQKQIVRMLEAVNTHISNLEKLISKQESIKKSTIKLLLQPKDNWNKVKLGDVSNMFSGGTPAVDNKSFYNNGNIPFIRSGEIAARQTELHITENALNNSSAKMVQRGDLLFALYGATSGNVAISNIAGAINQAILCIRSQIIVPNFLYHLLKHKQKYIISTFLQGGQGNLSAEIIKALTIRIPSVSEQTKIADTLSEIDAYIETLKQQLKKQQNLKQGLMEYFFGD